LGVIDAVFASLFAFFARNPAQNNASLADARFHLRL
jgi:hypothetical protein